MVAAGGGKGAHQTGLGARVRIFFSWIHTDCAQAKVRFPMVSLFFLMAENTGYSEDSLRSADSPGLCKVSRPFRGQESHRTGAHPPPPRTMSLPVKNPEACALLLPCELPPKPIFPPVTAGESARHTQRVLCEDIVSWPCHCYSPISQMEKMKLGVPQRFAWGWRGCQRPGNGRVGIQTWVRVTLKSCF